MVVGMTGDAANPSRMWRSQTCQNPRSEAILSTYTALHSLYMSVHREDMLANTNEARNGNRKGAPRDRSKR